MLGFGGPNFESEERISGLERRETFKLLSASVLSPETRRAKTRLMAVSFAAVLSQIGNFEIDLSTLGIKGSSESATYILEIAALFYLLYLITYYFMYRRSDALASTIFEFSSAVRASMKENRDAILDTLAFSGSQHLIQRYHQRLAKLPSTDMYSNINFDIRTTCRNALFSALRDYRRLEDWQDLLDDSSQRQHFSSRLSEQLVLKLRELFESRGQEKFSFHEDALREAIQHATSDMTASVYNSHALRRERLINDRLFHEITATFEQNRVIFDRDIPLFMGVVGSGILVYRLLWS